MRVGITPNGRNTPKSNRPSNEFFKNQKRRHAEVKSIKSSEMGEFTPVRRKSFFNSRRNSMKKVNAVSNYGGGGVITPLSSANKNNLPVFLRSSSSSGYHSLKKTQNSLEKAHDEFEAPFRKRLNCHRVFLQSKRSTTKVGKCRLYVPTNCSNNLPPRAMPNLPGMSSSFELWRCMIEKELKYKRDPNYFLHQAYISPQMRAVLLEWMLDVCEAYNMDHETYYLSVDYLDRYLSLVNDVPTQVLQAVGTTALYVAAKLHEITPPTMENFVGVTDGACNDHDILAQESHLLMKIDWNLQPITPLSWLTLFLQIALCQDACDAGVGTDGGGGGGGGAGEYRGPLTRLRYLRLSESSHTSKQFMLQQANHDENCAFYLKVLSACISDPTSLRFSYGVIAASLLNLTTNIDVFDITGFGSDEISACTKWLKQFVVSIRQKLFPFADVTPNLISSDPSLNCLFPLSPSQDCCALKDCTNSTKGRSFTSSFLEKNYADFDAHHYEFSVHEKENLLIGSF